MSRRRRDSEAPPPPHPAEGLDAFDGGSTIDPYQGADAALDVPAPADDDDQDDADEEPSPSTERDADADTVAAELRLELFRESGPLRWTPACPTSFPCALPEGDGPGACRYRLPAEPAFGCALALAEAGPRTLEAVGEVLGVGRARAGQLEARALRKVRVALEAVDPAAFAEDDLDELDDLDDNRPQLRALEQVRPAQEDEQTAGPVGAAPTKPSKVNARASAATLASILRRHSGSVRDIAAAASTQAPQAEAHTASGRELSRAVRALRRAVDCMRGGRRSC